MEIELSNKIENLIPEEIKNSNFISFEEYIEWKENPLKIIEKANSFISNIQKEFIFLKKDFEKESINTGFFFNISIV